MSQFSADMESDIESELIDLGVMSMRSLRERDGATVRRAMRHVMQHTEHPRVSRGSSERID